jgi:transposase
MNAGPDGIPASVASLTEEGIKAMGATKTKTGLALMLPHRKGRKREPLQDGRKLRRYKRRWKVERTFAWLGNFRRLVVRYEWSLRMYRAFFHVACLLITLRKL